MPLRFLLITAGSRGDTEPFVALAHALKKVGREAVVAAPARYRRLAAPYGVRFHPLDDTSLDLQDQLVGRSAFAALRAMPLAKRAFRRYLDDVAALAAVSADIDMVVYHPKALAAPMVAKYLCIPSVAVQLIPLCYPTRAFPAPLFTSPVPRLFNRATWSMLDWIEGPWRTDLIRIWKKRLNMPGQPPRLSDHIRKHGTLSAWSPTLLPAPSDWPPPARPLGFWRLPPTDWNPPTSLTDFLAAGDPPVYVGFGSMVGRNPAALGDMVAKGLRRAGRRGVVVTGAGGIEIAPSDDICVIEEAPHWWLMPRTAAAVHHGGVGTTTSALLAGVPQVFRPFMGDQRFWADRARALGAAVLLEGQGPDAFAAAIERAIADCTDTARALAPRVAEDDGLPETVERLLRRSFN